MVLMLVRKEFTPLHFTDMQHMPVERFCTCGDSLLQIVLPRSCLTLLRTPEQVGCRVDHLCPLTKHSLLPPCPQLLFTISAISKLCYFYFTVYSSFLSCSFFLWFLGSNPLHKFNKIQQMAFRGRINQSEHFGGFILFCVSLFVGMVNPTHMMQKA